MAAPPGDDEFLTAVLRNPKVREVLRRAEGLDLPDWYLAAGCLFQTVWNVLDGRDPEHGINDYDLIYFDGSDLSWDAEDAVIRRCADAFGDLAVDVEVRNQARVHLWYEDHFGVPCPPLRSSADAVDRYAAHACRVAVRSSGGRFDVYAPSGYDDLFAFVVRPNPVVAPRHVYETKSARWANLWPRLRVLPWPTSTPAGAS
ncbi:MAG TPA: nucleotidyltransferase family protein [Acidimicrobiales bacterium]